MALSDINPNNLSLKELAHYGLQHSDPWIQRLALLADKVAFMLEHAEERWYEEDLEEYFDDFRSKITNLKWELDQAEQTIADTEEDLQKANDRVKSLQYDLSRDRQEEVIQELKARIHDRINQHKEMQAMIKREQEEHARTKIELEKVQREFKYLQEKHNTWTVIAT